MDPRLRFRKVLWPTPIVVLVLAGMVALFPFFAPPSATIAGMVGVEDATVSAVSVTPGARTQLTIRFTTTRELEISNSITFEVSDTLGVPRAIDPNHVSISGRGTASRTGPGSAGPFAQLSAPPGSVVVRDNPAESRHEITLEIPDMSIDDTVGDQDGLAAGEVIVIFRRSAGITNRTEGGKDEWFLYTTAEPDLAAIPQENVYEVPFTVELSEYHVHRGEKITVTGRGFERDTTVTFWRDSDEDGSIDSEEAVLCTMTASSKYVGKCAFTVTVPPFQGGLGIPGDFNYINALDGLGQSGSVDLPLVHLEPLLAITPDKVPLGDHVHVHLSDLDPGDQVSRIQLAGQLLCDSAFDGNYDGTPDLPCEAFVDEDHAHANAIGSLNFTFSIPARSLGGNPIFTGLQVMQVFLTAQDRSVHGKEVEAVLHVTPGHLTTSGTTVLPNQRIIVSGSGFTKSSNHSDSRPAFIGPVPENVAHTCLDDVRIAATDHHWGQVTLDGVELDWSRINNGNGIEISGGGTWSVPIDLPLNLTTAPGVRKLKVTDCYGGSGAIDLTFPEREVTISPEEGQAGSNVVINGRNFPVSNDSGSETKIIVSYDATCTGGDKKTVEPDSAGNFTVLLRIPAGACTPSNNTIRVEFVDDDESLVLDTFTHRVPPGTMSFNPASGPPGTSVAVTGQGFRPYTAVHKIDFGALDVMTDAALSTDGRGGFDTTFLVPDTRTGPHTVMAGTDGITVSAPFTVTADLVMHTPAPLPPANALAPLIANDNNLVRVWQFDASRQNEGPDFGWFLYDTSEVFASANNLEMIESGRFYWIKVREAQTATMGGKERVLYSGWNPVSW